jgi:hypothetical protein
MPGRKRAGCEERGVMMMMTVRASTRRNKSGDSWFHRRDYYAKLYEMYIIRYLKHVYTREK